MMEPGLRDHRAWLGTLGVSLGGDLHVDMSETDPEYDIKDFIKHLKRLQQE